MTPREINKAIAEVCGWSQLKPTQDGSGFLGLIPPLRGWVHIPDYYFDLNDMHAAEKKLDVNQLSRYADELDKVCVPIHICPLTHWHSVVTASASRRAEAFLRALGKWKDD